MDRVGLKSEHRRVLSHGNGTPTLARFVGRVGSGLGPCGLQI